MFDIRNHTQKILTGCIIRADNGVNMYTPDGVGNYPALWTRDFSYLLEYAQELLPAEDVKNGIEYLLSGAAENGWIDEKKIVMENLTAMKRAGANMIITYHAVQAAKWIYEERAGKCQ